MARYMKDRNGHPGSVINGQMEGLFFSGFRLPNGKLPGGSCFGDVRFSLSASILLNPYRHNLYFADFYCVHTKWHYCTVVVTVKGSPTDKTCLEKLKPLPWQSNGLLEIRHADGSCLSNGYVPPVDQLTHWINYALVVEIFFTESIHVSCGQFDTVHALKKGSSTIGGIPLNSACNVCNW